MKRGQVTIFIIVGVVILVIAGLLFTINISAPESQDVSADSLRPYVSECLSNQLEQAVQTGSIQGGFLDPPQSSVLLREPFRTPYFYAGEKSIPPQNVLEQELSEYVNMLMPVCNLQVFEEQGFNLDTGDIKADVSLTRNNVNAELNYPITLKKDNVTINKEKFSAKIQSRLGEYYDYAGEITNLVATYEQVPLSDLVAMGKENDFQTDIIHEENGTVIFRFYDNESVPQNYNFAVKLNKTEESEDMSELNIPSQTASVGYTFTYEFNRTNLTAHTDMFDINLGIINFTPQYEDKGKHMVLISSPRTSAYMNITIESENDPPQIEPISDKYLNVGEDFAYQVNVHDNNTTFYNAETGLDNFNINVDTGQITYTPSTEQIGTHNVTIVVVDEYGLKDNETFRVQIYE